MKASPKLTDAGIVFLRQIQAGVGRATWRTGGRVQLLERLKRDGLVEDVAGEISLTLAGTMTLWSIDNAAARNRRLRGATRG